MDCAPKLLRQHGRNGAALIIVLALVVLFSGLALAYLSRTVTDRQLAQSSYHDTSADLLARSALDVIVGDLRQEIAAGSSSTTVNGLTVYTPNSTANMLPTRSGNPIGSPDPVPNLVRRSYWNDTNLSVRSRASNVNSTTGISLNGRSVSSTRWNSHYLVPKGNTANNDSSPVPAFTNATPDWVFVTIQGATPSPSPADVIGRYAYAIYDEGGLLDANLVGLPSPAPGAVAIASPSPSRSAYPSRKGTIAFADLTALPLSSGGSTPNPLAISRIVGWRNYATTTVPTSQTFPDLSPSPSPFVTYFLSNNSDFLTVNSASNANGRTDQALNTRSELIQLVLSSIGTNANLLQYLGTFSRELNGPTWQSASNPISQRFQLDKISLLGSSPTPSPSPGNAPAIKTYFGLQWSTSHRRWQYVGQGTTLLSAIPTPAPNGSPSPDFFQVLNYAYPGHTILQILSLGASIIDQYDADQVTTAVEYSGSPGVAWGMENRGSPLPMGSPSPSPVPTPISGYVVLQRPFQNVGELGYAYNKATGNTLDFRTSGSSDAALLDFFTYSISDNTAIYELPCPLRAGPVNINTRNASVLAAILSGASPSETSPTTGVTPAIARTAAGLIAGATNTQPALNRQDLARLVAAVGNTLGSSDENKETVARALSDTTQTRTWGLLIDVIAQTGRYPPGATNLSQFIVEGEKRYWFHVAIDRFFGEIIDEQLEEVNE
jgi:Tfp pilus assembly protein PilX